MAHYQTAMGFVLSPFEQLTIREFSVIYSNGLQEYRKKGTPPPFVSEAVTKSVVNDAAESWVKMMLAIQKKQKQASAKN